MVFPVECFAQEIEGLKGVKPPVALPMSFLILWVLLGLILITAAAFFVIRFFKQRTPTPQPIPALPAHIIALQRLEDLRSQELPSAGKIKEFYSVLSDIIRRYLEDRFVLRAPEMTTEEFLFSLKYSTALTAAHKDSLKDFLESCDLVKFAKYRSNLDEMEHSFCLAKKLVEETKPLESSI